GRPGPSGGARAAHGHPAATTCRSASPRCTRRRRTPRRQPPRELSIPKPVCRPGRPAPARGEKQYTERPWRRRRRRGASMPEQQAPESLRVDDELEKEFASALQYELRDDDIERARLLLGVDTAYKTREHFSVATPDVIRNWAYGTGDDNPLYTDEGYGPTTRWGSQIAPATLAGHVKTPMLGDPVPAEVKERTKHLFRGIHVFVSGGTWDWYRPIYPGDRLFAFGGEETLDVKQSEF